MGIHPLENNQGARVCMCTKDSPGVMLVFSPVHFELLHSGALYEGSRKSGKLFKNSKHEAAESSLKSQALKRRRYEEGINTRMGI